MLARAKLNLALHVTGQRAQGPQAGYHLLHTLVAFASIGDGVQATPGEADSLTVDGPFAAQVPPLAHNSLGKALALVRRWGEAQAPLSIRLTKTLPVASGIGGGSADAAALITLLTGGRALSGEERADCLALGADVPMCLAGRAAVVEGIGETVNPVNLPPAHVVLVNPGVAVATPAVFSALRQKDNPPLPPWPAPAALDDLVAYLRATRNDLTAPAMALAPEIGACLSALSSAPFARMSGSGATCLALLETAQDAQDLAARVRRDHPHWWVQAGRLG